MLRLAGTCIAVLALATACALTEPLPPPGTVPVQIQVANRSARDVELAVTIDERPIPGSAQPPVLAAGETVRVVFHVPIAAGWALSVNGVAFLPDLRGRTGEIVDIGVIVDAQGNVSSWCSGRC